MCPTKSSKRRASSSARPSWRILHWPSWPSTDGIVSTSLSARFPERISRRPRMRQRERSPSGEQPIALLHFGEVAAAEYRRHGLAGESFAVLNGGGRSGGARRFDDRPQIAEQQFHSP